jgi:hypothetical protein
MPVLRTRSAPKPAPVTTLQPLRLMRNGSGGLPMPLSRRGATTEPNTPESPTLLIQANRQARRQLQGLERDPTVIIANSAKFNANILPM